MLPGFRILAAMVVLGVGMLVFGLGAVSLMRAAQLRAGPDNLAAWRPPAEPGTIKPLDRQAVLALLRVDPPPAHAVQKGLVADPPVVPVNTPQDGTRDEGVDQPAASTAVIATAPSIPDVTTTTLAETAPMASAPAEPVDSESATTKLSEAAQPGEQTEVAEPASSVAPAETVSTPAKDPEPISAASSTQESRSDPQDVGQPPAPEMAPPASRDGQPTQVAALADSAATRKAVADRQAAAAEKAARQRRVAEMKAARRARARLRARRLAAARARAARLAQQTNSQFGFGTATTAATTAAPAFNNTPFPPPTTR